MARLAFLYRTDVHASDKNPASWKGNYLAEIWSSLEEIGRIAKEHEVVAVLDGGDYFHIKVASRNSNALVIKTTKIAITTTNEIEPLKITPIYVSLAIPAITYTPIPTGGVIFPIPTHRTIKIPNQIGSSPIARATGKKPAR